MTKTVSTRIDDDLAKILDEECGKSGINKCDYLNRVLVDALNGDSNIESKDLEPKEDYRLEMNDKPSKPPKASLVWNASPSELYKFGSALTIQLFDDGYWRDTRNNEIIKKNDPRFSKAVKVKLVS